MTNTLPRGRRGLPATPRGTLDATGPSQLGGRVLQGTGLGGARLSALAAVFAASAALAGPGHDHGQQTLRSALQADATDARAQERQRVEIYQAWYPDRATAHRAAVTLHNQLLESDYAAGFQVFELDGEQMALLQRFGYRIEPALDFVRRRDAFLAELDAATARLNTQRRAQGLPDTDAGIQAIPGYACYETVEETTTAALGFVASRPKLADWTVVGQSWQRTVGQGGYDIGVLKLSNKDIPAPTGGKPKLFIHSAMHAREYTTAPLALAFARWLLDGHGVDADATWILDHHEVHLMLHVNPDGRKRAETGLSWRKNTNTAYCGATSNNRGADLNRNFSFAWNSTNGQGSSGVQCNGTYRGPSPSSEPETRAVENYVRSLWPDRRGPGVNDPAPPDTSGIHIDLHSYSELVLWPWGATASPAPNGPALQTLGRRLAWFNGYNPTQSIGLYPTDGTSDGPSYGELGVAAFTFELGTSFFQNCSVFENTIKPKNLPALVYAAKVVRAPYLLPGGPEVTALALDTEGPVLPGTLVLLSGLASDARFNQGNGSEAVQAIAAAQAFIGTPPWADGATPIALGASDGSFNNPTEAVSGALPTTGMAPGRHLIYVQASDSSGQVGPVSAVFLDIAAPPLALSLTANPTRTRGFSVSLFWSGATGPYVDVYRNGVKLLPILNQGVYNDDVLRGTWQYRVCQRNSSTQCSAFQTVSF